MWGRIGYAAAIVGTVIGGAALCFVVASVMYLGIFAFVGTADTGPVTHWDNVFPFSLFADSEQRNSPRVVIRGGQIGARLHALIRANQFPRDFRVGRQDGLAGPREL